MPPEIFLLKVVASPVSRPPVPGRPTGSHAERFTAEIAEAAETESRDDRRGSELRAGIELGLGIPIPLRALRLNGRSLGFLA